MGDNEWSSKELRRRRGVKANESELRTEKKSTEANKKEKDEPELQTGTYWLTRIIFLRSIGFIYACAFLVAYNQNIGLIGSNGLLPAKLYVQRVKQYAGKNIYNQILMCPSVLLFVEYSNYDYALNCIAVIGLTISIIITIHGAANMLVMTILWMLYHSLVNVGQTWMGITDIRNRISCNILCPLCNAEKFPKYTPTSVVVVYGYRWLIFRIMLGAGLIKIRGDQCWRDLTCMDYHYQTQPVPNPISYYLHQSPKMIHRLETAGNHVVELIIPFFLFGPRKLTMVAGIGQIVFQVILILSGNLSFLNWLTILPSIFCFDDRSLSSLFPKSYTATVAKRQIEENNKTKIGIRIRTFVNFLLFCLIAFLSYPVVMNLVSSKQAMNRSFDSLRIVNTYGAFGSVTKTRTEVILQGTSAVDPHSPNAEWHEYEFYCKPGNVTKRPCVISPYHYRLDWLMWFAAFQNYQQNPWLIHLVAKLLANDHLATSLILHNPFVGNDPPKYIRAMHYKYQYTKYGNNRWWKRKKIGEYLPPVGLSQLQHFLKANNFPALEAK